MGEVAGPEAGPSRKWWTAEEESPSCDGEMDLDDSPSKSMLQGTNKGHQMKVSSLATPFSNSESNTEKEILKYWVTEDLRKQNMKILHSATDSTLVEEALRGSIAIVQDLLGRGLSLRFPVCFIGRWNRGERKRLLGFGNKNPTNVGGCGESLGSGRFLDWRALDASGTAGGILICWDKRTLEILDWEEGQFSLSCRFRNVENGTVWVFTELMDLSLKEERECLWEEIGAIRGLWEDPWADGYSSAKGVFTWSGGPNNQSWARLDRSWWWEIEVRGSASFRLATKLKEIKQKLKVWNKEVFGNLGCNKAAALQQVESRTLWKVTEFYQPPRSRKLEAPFSEAEVHPALMEMNGDKAPGRMVYSSLWQNCGAEDIGDFRPISLLGGLYKLLAKVLANRLKKVIGKVVSPAQNAFVKGRQILDASLIANEAIDSWQKRKEKGVICKLDIEKAYDNMNWQASPRRSSISLPLCNGNGSVGVLIRRVVEGGFLSGCNIREGGRTALNISHLFFANDTIVFCEANKDHLSHLSWILFWFEAASGLKINLGKSEIIPVGEVDDIEELAVEIGCRVGCLSSQYLGLPLGAPNKASSVWDEVEERARRRLALWKRQFISKGGRITLIKSTLASIPIYQMSLFRMPKIVVRRIEKLQRDFLWGGGNMERKVHLVKWEIVCGDKERGGLGLRKLGLLNKALLGKWIGGVWKEIMKETDWCWDNIEFMVGKGTKIRFWTDVWNATVEEMWDQNSDQGGWNLRFLRNFNDWEVGMVGDLFLKLRGLRPSLEEDSVSWKGGKNGKFKVKEAYSCLVNLWTPFFRKKCIWVDSVPTKVAFFAWEATWGKAKALAEKNRYDLQTQQEQEERHRIAESLDTKIKHWAAGKEGNLRALLSSLQYVLGPECGWQPVSLTDLITSDSVRKVTERPPWCIHPDKIQQKGSLEQVQDRGRPINSLDDYYYARTLSYFFNNCTRSVPLWEGGKGAMELLLVNDAVNRRKRRLTPGNMDL
ncbi:Auxilin-related protein 1 [Vitis vinifera]|uniref:Auxilin-related protein 1 n=1 Tax=Vitis vinifera TaxID=29760 RepID=A0A438K431_VITVI|nr:Auxilin-related protein 1 [Vitis vinifera]